MHATLEQARAAHLANDLATAETAYRAVLSPDGIEALHGLGLLALSRDDAAAALPLIEAAHRLAPAGRSAHNLAMVLKRLGRTDAAIGREREATAQYPDYVPAWLGLADLLTETGARAEATAVLVAFADRAVRAGSQDLVRDAVERVLALDANHTSLLWLASLLRMGGQADAARRVLDIRLRAAPDDIGAGLIRAVAQLTRVSADAVEQAHCRAAYATELDRVATLVAQAPAPVLAEAAAVIGLAQPFLLAYHGENDRDLQQRYGGVVASLAAAQGFPPAPLAPPPRPGERIRVGFASAHLHMHSVSKTHGGWITQLDRSRFAVFGYQFSPARDAVSDRLAACCDRFAHCVGDVATWRARILEDAPHALIYLDIGMEQTSVRMAALRLAAVQCTTWGHPDTSGLPTLDYYLSSEAMEPPDGDAHYTERLVRLPGLGICYTPPPDDGATMPRAALGLRDDAVVYLCCQSLNKYLPRDDALWPRIAAGIPAAQFLFLSAPGGNGDAVFRGRLQRAFAAAGLDWQRHCVLTPPVPYAAFPGLLRAADVFLDSIGWSGCNSTLEAVACDLPVVTTPTALMRGRHTAAILACMGLAHRIAADADAYVAQAVRLADAGERARYVAELRGGRGGVFGNTAPVRALEDFLECAVRGQGVESYEFRSAR
jgi:predicted O-linked N-acetylglucosamine transferase (SPINDLY family)